MVIFNGYVKLPEGNKKQSVVLQKYWGWLVACD